MARQDGGGQERYPCIILGLNDRHPGDYLQQMRWRNESVKIRWEMRGDVQMVKAHDVTLQVRWTERFGERPLHAWEHDVA